MRVLLTNNTLALRAGTELYVRDVSIELMRRGHQPVVYSTHLGEIAAEIRAATVPVISKLETVGEPPDVIHAQHNYEAIAALTQFPGTPAVSFCHGWFPWEESPLLFPQVRRYVAVSKVCRERLIAEGGISPERVELIPNFVDRRLFPPRDSLPGSPRRALSFSNTIGEHADLPVLRKACAVCGVQLDAIGHAVGRIEAQPGGLLAQYDIVFARGRAAIEAMAVGAAVILCDAGRLGPMVTTRNFAELRELNFALRSLSDPVTEGRLTERIRQYDGGDAERVSEIARRECSVERAVDRIVHVYQRAIEEAWQQPPVTAAACNRALVRYLEESAPHFKGSMLERRKLELERDEELRRLRQELGSIRASATWRWGQMILRNSLVRGLFGGLIERVATNGNHRTG